MTMENPTRKTRKRIYLIGLIILLFMAIVIFLIYWSSHNKLENTANPTVMAIQGLVLYYPFNGNANDMSGNNNDGEVHGAVLTTDRFGKKNSAYYFDGIDDSITFKGIKLPIGSAPRTISAWIKADGFPPPAPQLPQIGSRATIIGWGRDDSLQLSAMEVVNNQLTHHVYNWDVTGSRNIEINKWYHLVIVNSGEKTSLYVNGKLEEYDSRVLDTANLPGRIGAFPDQSVKGPLFPDGYDMSYFHGIIDDISIYDQALASEQVQMLYNENIK